MQKRDVGKEAREREDRELEDKQWQSKIMKMILDAHPEPLTTVDLARELLDKRDNQENGALLRAEFVLWRGGLMLRDHGDVTPTKEALLFDSLDLERQ